MKYVGLGPKRVRGPKSLDLYCRDCQYAWCAGRYPMSVSTIEAITKSLCPNCHGPDIEVFETSVQDPNDV